MLDVVVAVAVEVGVGVLKDEAKGTGRKQKLAHAVMFSALCVGRRPALLELFAWCVVRVRVFRVRVLAGLLRGRFKARVVLGDRADRLAVEARENEYVDDARDGKDGAAAGLGSGLGGGLGGGGGGPQGQGAEPLLAHDEYA